MTNQKKMNDDELVANEFLKTQHTEPPVYEPCGRDTMPDFLFKKQIAIEVMRLLGISSENEEIKPDQYFIPVYKKIKETFHKFKDNDSSKSYGIVFSGDESLPYLNKENGKIKAEKLMKELYCKLNLFLCNKDSNPSIFKLKNGWEFTIVEETQRKEELFYLIAIENGESFEQLSITYAKGIIHCINEKEGKIRGQQERFEQKNESFYFQQWWLLLVDHIGISVDIVDLQRISDRLNCFGIFNKILLLTFPYGDVITFEQENQKTSFSIKKVKFSEDLIKPATTLKDS